MTPILFSSSETAFTSNGLGRLTDCLSCIVDEEINGEYELTIEYPLNGIHYEDISGDKQIVVKVSDGSRQIFRIYSIERVLNQSITIRAHHISYDLNKRACVSFSPGSQGRVTASYTWTKMQENAVILPTLSDFTFYTDTTSEVPIGDILNGGFYKGRSVRQMLFDTGGRSFYNYFSGEFEWNNKEIRFLTHRGQDRDVTIRYGKNLSNINVTENTDLYNAVLPYTTDGESNVIYGTGWNACVYNVQSTSEIYAVMPLDMTDNNEKFTATTIKGKAQQWFDQNQPWLPVNEIKVSFASEDENTSALAKILLGDTVKIYHKDFNVSGSMRVIKTSWDVLMERYKNVELSRNLSSLTGDYSRFKRQIVRRINAVNKRLNKAIEEDEEQSGDALDVANAVRADFDALVQGTYNNTHNYKYLNLNRITGANYVELKNQGNTGGNGQIYSRNGSLYFKTGTLERQVAFVESN